MTDLDVRTAMSCARDLQGLSETPRLDVELLLQHATGWDRARLLAWPEHSLNDEEARQFLNLFEQRKQGHPVAHLVGRRQFWSLELEVTPDTLIPRPETEILVELALELALPADARVADLGAGTGAIALALATERPGWKVTGVEQSPDAYAVAMRNRDRLGLDRIELCQQRWEDFSPETALDLVVSNPPYVEEDSPWLSQGDVQFEPESALVSGPDGLEAIRDLASRARGWLRPGGWLALEHGSVQAAAVRDLLARNDFQEVASRTDLAGLDRVTFARAPLDE